MCKFEIGKKYVTRDGYPARVICVDMQSRFPIVIACQQDKSGSEYCLSLTEDGKLTQCAGTPFIKEYDPLEEVRNLPIDAPIWVKYRQNMQWFPRHFAGIHEDSVQVYPGGGTSFTQKVTLNCFDWSINKPEDA